jgi:hypothetical protein
MRLQAKVRLVVAIRDAFGEAEAYVGGKCAVECMRDALREEAEHLDEWAGIRAHNISLMRRTRSTHSTSTTRSEHGRVGRLAAVCGASGAAAPAWLYTSWALY